MPPSPPLSRVVALPGGQGVLQLGEFVHYSPPVFRVSRRLFVLNHGVAINALHVVAARINNRPVFAPRAILVMLARDRSVSHFVPRRRLGV